MVPGSNNGKPSAATSESDRDGTVELLHAGSSPMSASTPPFGDVPANTACLIASPARSRPGALPYQYPATPSTLAVFIVDTSWLPATAVAASSSLIPGHSLIP